MFNRKKIKELEDKIKELEGSLDVFNKRVIREQNPRKFELLDEVSFNREYSYPNMSYITGGYKTESTIIDCIVIDFKFYDDDNDCSWYYRVADKETKSTYWVEQNDLKKGVTL